MNPTRSVREIRLSGSRKGKWHGPTSGEYAPRPFLSTLIDDRIERARDVRAWNCEPDCRDVTLFGLNTVADSVAAALLGHGVLHEVRVQGNRSPHTAAGQSHCKGHTGSEDCLLRVESSLIV